MMAHFSNQLLKNKQEEFMALKYNSVIKAMSKDFELRKNFIKEFTINKINEMTLDQYVVGKKDTFCKKLETDLRHLGVIQGTTAFKFGIYYGKEKSDPSVVKYRFKEKWGNSEAIVFNNVKKEILKLLDDGKKENFEGMVQNKLSKIFKGKLLSVYFPHRYLSIFTKNHLDHFLTVFNLDTKELIRKDPVLKRERLLQFKNSDEYFNSWSNEMFVYFLYNEYPCKPRKDNNKKTGGFHKYRHFEPGVPGEKIDLKISAFENRVRGNDMGNQKVDYLQQHIIRSEIGARGEKIVLEYEKNKLKASRYKHLIEKITQVSDFSDSHGYDILSFNPETGDEKYIEVKTTSASPGETTFYLSENEYKKAHTLINYNIYIVYDIHATPKLWELGNPFNPHNDNIKVTTSIYRVCLKGVKIDEL